MSALLGIAEKFARHRRGFDQLTLRDGIIVGVAQIFALIPGVSRSGATLTAGLFCGMERETAARFSFLLGLPAITLAGFYELHVLFKASLGSDGWVTLLIGLATASVTAFAAIYAAAALPREALDLDIRLVSIAVRHWNRRRGGRRVSAQLSPCREARPAPALKTRTPPGAAAATSGIS